MATSRKDMRQWLAHMTEENREAIWQALYEAVHGDTTRRGHCPRCGLDVQVSFPDANGRANAAKILLDQGFGRPKETVVVDHTIQQKPVNELGDGELEAWLGSDGNGIARG